MTYLYQEHHRKSAEGELNFLQHYLQVEYKTLLNQLQNYLSHQIQLIKMQHIHYYYSYIMIFYKLIQGLVTGV